MLAVAIRCVFKSLFWSTKLVYILVNQLVRLKACNVHGEPFCQIVVIDCLTLQRSFQFTMLSWFEEIDGALVTIHESTIHVWEGKDFLVLLLYGKK